MVKKPNSRSILRYNAILSPFSKEEWQTLVIKFSRKQLQRFFSNCRMAPSEETYIAKYHFHVLSRAHLTRKLF